MAWRDSRSQRLKLLVFSCAIISGVAALTAIHSLKAGIERGVSGEAKALLGSDLRISSRREIPQSDIEVLRTRAEKIGRELAFPSMMRFPKDGGARMMQVRALTGDFPFYGEVLTRPAEAWETLKEGGGVLLDPAVLDQFSVALGDEVELGGIRYRVAGVIEKPAPRGGRFSGFAPEVYVSLADIERSGLLKGNSLVSHQVHLKIGDGPAGRDLKKQMQDDFPEKRWRMETPEDRQENVGEALDRFQRFLSIIALASLVLGAIGVAGAVHTHVRRRLATVSVLRCLGCPGHIAFGIYFVQAMVLGLLGAVFGGVVGILLQTGLLSFLGSELPVSVEVRPEWQVAARTIATGFVVCCGFALLPLMKIRGISPARALRSSGDLPSGKTGLLLVGFFLVGLLMLAAYGNDPHWGRAGAMTGGLVLAFLALAGVARLLIAVTRRLTGRRWPYLLRQGISNLHRPGNQTLLFLLSPGLGTFLLVTVLSAGTLLNDRLNWQRSVNSPNLYLIDVQADQVEGVEGLLKERGLPVLDSTPMVTMRIESVRGVPVGDLEDVPGWVSRREFRSTYRDELNATEEVVAGELAVGPADLSGVVSLSLEEKIAGDLGVGLGDELVMDVQGVPVRTKVTSLRRVDWSQFNLNFFMVFPTGVLEEAPGFQVVTTRTPNPTASGDLQRELAARFANVTAIDLTQILKTVRELLEKISMVVTVLAGFTLLAGVPIFLGTLLNGREVRLRESVLLRTLGASGAQVRAILVIEFAVLGLLAALTGVLLAMGANAILALMVFEASPWPDPTLVFGAVGVVTLVAVAGGMLLSRGVTRNPPLEILRSDG
jgi:putative ABC transport system permease protein